MPATLRLKLLSSTCALTVTFAVLTMIGPRTGCGCGGTSDSQLSDLESGLKTFDMDVGTFPEKLEDLLVAPPEHENAWNGPYLAEDALPTDAWNEEFEYTFPGEHNKTGFDLWSKGPDKESGTEDDFQNWKKR